MIIDHVIHNGVGYSQMRPDQLAEAGVPVSIIDAVIAARIARTAESEIDRLGDLLSVSSSRAARYTQKFEEAKAYIAANRPANVSAGAYPMLVAEADARGITKSALADMIVARGNGFVALMTLAEVQRFKIGQVVAAAATVAEKQAVAEGEVAVFRAAVNAVLAA